MVPGWALRIKDQDTSIIPIHNILIYLNELALGLSASVGINYFVERFEVFLQLTPRLNLIPRTNADLGGGVGLRYYF